MKKKLNEIKDLLIAIYYLLSLETRYNQIYMIFIFINKSFIKKINF
jgi:hypothetical protein